MWSEGLGWDMARISPYVLSTTKLELTAVIVDTVTGVKDRLSDCVKFIKDLSKEVTEANLKILNKSSHVPRVERMIGWVALEDGWSKMNTDGASQENPGLATAGGVLRNSAREWCGGFTLNIGRCSALLAELWGVYYGLYTAWEHRVTREANRLADGLANYAFSLPLGFHAFVSVPIVVDSILRDDVVGTTVPRPIRM
ncbi:Ribonuclease H domain [Arabidopsis thaliana x Arabidopsis arenosa]|uniref:Ribonuclease H domain n=1 Tax=Arabidopsis thaliana x Arabidopsis arenosa TaxID=1240361 RepID=A0A8T2C7B6_9BRAS|nr:Ribonuclease H domain [Arabidopsis thaliana x Arabidopsis arenosa]